jgi:hypothetical protein
VRGAGLEPVRPEALMKTLEDRVMKELSMVQLIRLKVLKGERIILMAMTIF